MVHDQYLVTFDLIDLVKAQNQALKGQLVQQNAMDSRQTVISSGAISPIWTGSAISSMKKLTGIRGALPTRISYVIQSPQKPLINWWLLIMMASMNKYLLRSREPLMSWSPRGRRLAYVSFENKSWIFVQEPVYPSALSGLFPWY